MADVVSVILDSLRAVTTETYGRAKKRQRKQRRSKPIINRTNENQGDAEETPSNDAYYYKCSYTSAMYVQDPECQWRSPYSYTQTRKRKETHQARKQISCCAVSG